MKRVRFYWIFHHNKHMVEWEWRGVSHTDGEAIGEQPGDTKPSVMRYSINDNVIAVESDILITIQHSIDARITDDSITAWFSAD